MHRWLFRAAVLLSVAALVGGGWYAIARYRSTSGPRAAVSGYFSALARGDAPAALAYGAVPAGGREFLTSQVLAEQRRIARLRDVRITGVTQTGSRAVVRFSYRLRYADGSQPVSGSLAVDRRAGRWRLVATAVRTTVRIDQAADRLSFAGTAVPEGPALLFPGALPVRFDTGYLRLARSTADARFGVSDTEARVEASATATTDLNAALDRALAACVASPSPTMDCPLPSAQYVPGSLQGRIIGRTLSWSVSSDAAGVVDATGSVVFSGRYRRLAYDNVPEAEQGRVRLPVVATAYAIAPLTVRFAP